MTELPFDNSTRFAGKRVHLGICGSIACYRAADLLRAWRKLNIHVSATITESAQRFVSPMLFKSLGAMPVYESMFAPDEDVFAHLEPGQHAHAMVVAPASADTLARLAHGNASDMLAAQALAFDGPLIIAPAMNPRMWDNSAVKANVAVLRERGAHIVAPGHGEAACGDTGFGRMADLPEIFLAVLRALSPQDMKGRKALVTAGPTREPWDGFRYWSNPSSGLMGASLAVCAFLRGAEVTALCGPINVTGALFLPDEVRRCAVESAREMFDAAQTLWPRMDMGIFAAAVADFSPQSIGQKKFKKSKSPEGFTLAFHPNPDILETLAHSRKSGQKVLGFAAETVSTMQELLPMAAAKLKRKKADVLAANRVNEPAAGFCAPTNSVAVVDSRGREEIWPMQSKADVAWDLCSWLSQF